MCDARLRHTHRLGARHSVPICARPAGHARACQSSFEQAGAGRTPICAPARRSLARSARARLSTLVACVHDTALLIASLPGSPMAGMGSPVSSIAASTSRSPSVGLASPQDRHPGRSAHQVQPQPP